MLGVVQIREYGRVPASKPTLAEGEGLLLAGRGYSAASVSDPKRPLRPVICVPLLVVPVMRLDIMLTEISLC
jgi:hypothetical protein